MGSESATHPIRNGKKPLTFCFSYCKRPSPSNCAGVNLAESI